jgi:hypothetical protein
MNAPRTKEEKQNIERKKEIQLAELAFEAVDANEFDQN